MPSKGGRGIKVNYQEACSSIARSADQLVGSLLEHAEITFVTMSKPLRNLCGHQIRECFSPIPVQVVGKVLQKAEV